MIFDSKPRHNSAASLPCFLYLSVCLSPLDFSAELYQQLDETILKTIFTTKRSKPLNKCLK